MTAFSVVDSNIKLILAIVGVLLFFISGLITVVIQLLKKEKDWYAGRALAESVKTLSWRFIMCAEPYEH